MMDCKQVWGGLELFPLCLRAYSLYWAAATGLGHTQDTCTRDFFHSFCTPVVDKWKSSVLGGGLQWEANALALPEADAYDQYQIPVWCFSGEAQRIHHWKRMFRSWPNHHGQHSGVSLWLLQKLLLWAQRPSKDSSSPRSKLYLWFDCGI